MLHFQNEPSEARRLTDVLRSGSTHGRAFDQRGTVREEEATLQLVLEGAVLRQRFLPDGRSHTVAIYFRDDVLNLGGYIGSAINRRAGDHLMALKATVIGSVPDACVAEMRSSAPAGQDGISVLAFRELGISQERSLTLATRSSTEAMAHFFCETAVRSGQRLAQGGKKFPLHLTQEALSSILGISTVHVNRTLQGLRQLGLADLVDSHLVIHDLDRLAQVASFDDYYLEPI